MHPNIQQQIETHKSYEAHIKKLSGIREGRHNSLQTRTSRQRSYSMHNYYPNSYQNKYAYNHQLPYTHHQQIRQKKHETFMNQYNAQQKKIQQANYKMFDRLKREQHRKSSKSNNYHYYIKGNPNMIERNQYNFSTQISSQTANLLNKNSRLSYKKAQVEKSQKKENERMKSKIKSYESSLSQKKFDATQNDRQKLRKRLLRYTDNHELKSATFIKPYTVKTVSLAPKNPYKSIEQSDLTSSSKKPKLSSFYNTESIRRNRIENYGLKLANLPKHPSQNNQTISSRGTPRSRQIKYGTNRNRSFFTTNIQ